MYWLMGGIILLGMSVLLRKLLGLDAKNRSAPSIRLNHEQRLALLEIAEEIERRSKGLSVRLDEAIGELMDGRFGNASNLLELAEWEWVRLAELLVTILRSISEYLPMATITIPVRSMARGHFRSDVMINYFGLHELMDQFLFRTKLRFHLQVRMLRQAVELLTSDFQQLLSQGNFSATSPQAIWNQLDRDYYDFDLIAKRTTLALDKFVTWLPESAAADVLLAVKAALHQNEHSHRRALAQRASYR